MLLSETELLRVTISVEKAQKARSNEESNRIVQETGYPVAGYNLKNEKVIDQLDITVGKQKNLKFYYKMILIKIRIDVNAIVFVKR